MGAVLLQQSCHPVGAVARRSSESAAKPGAANTAAPATKSRHGGSCGGGGLLVYFHEMRLLPFRPFGPDFVVHFFVPTRWMPFLRSLVEMTRLFAEH